jgi:tRNA G37 N-methylase Trm5
MGRFIKEADLDEKPTSKEEEEEEVVIKSEDEEEEEETPVLELPEEEGEEKDEEIKIKRRFRLPKRAISKLINSIFRTLEQKYPSVSGQLVLDETESELLDDALKPVVEKLISKAGIESDNVVLLFALATVFVPRLFVLFSLVPKKGEAK